jgi:hypothetical protein
MVRHTFNCMYKHSQIYASINKNRENDMPVHMHIFKRKNALQWECKGNKSFSESVIYYHFSDAILKLEALGYFEIDTYYYTTKA